MYRYNMFSNIRKVNKINDHIKSYFRKKPSALYTEDLNTSPIMKFTRQQRIVLPSCLNQLVLCLFCFELVNGTTNLNYTTEASTSKRPDHPDEADKLPLVLPVEMHQIFPKGRLPKGYKDVAWDLIPWEAPSELKQTLRYLPNKCKRGFQSCLLKDQTPSNYCDAASKSESCIISSGCSEREFRFIHLAACSLNTTNKPNPVDWSQNDWMVNILLKNTVENLSTKCLRQFEQCRDYVSVVKSYCDMMVVMAPTVWGSPERKLREGCLDVDCPESDVLDLVDAACTRSVVSWDDAAVNRWFAGTRLQVRHWTWLLVNRFGPKVGQIGPKWDKSRGAKMF